MCGIFGIVTKNENDDVISTLLDGLTRLEYRGYDSAGISFIDNKKIRTIKSVGEVSRLVKKVSAIKKPNTKIGIAHTRWATHGIPCDKNSHPHNDCTDTISIVHNGIIENFEEIKDNLKKKGHEFRSETDSEVLAHLIEEFLKKNPKIEEAILDTLSLIKGTYGLVVLYAKTPDRLYVARQSSPLVIGKGDGKMYVASDPVCLGSFTKEVLFLNDKEVATLTTDSVKVSKLNGKKVKSVFEMQNELHGWEEKGKYQHFMLKEIYDQPKAIMDGLRGRVWATKGTAKLGGIESVQKQFLNSSRIVIVACGTSLYAGEIIALWMEEIAKIPARAIDASELRNREFQWYTTDTAIFISQSGETADSMAALKIAQQEGVLCLGLINVVGSSLARETDAGIYLRAGAEVGVASTKAFTSQLLAGFLLTLMLARGKNRISQREGATLIKELNKLPDKIKWILNKQEKKIQNISKKVIKSPYILYLGRWLSLPIAQEGALKMKEIGYILSEGLGAGSIKHGPLALITPTVYTVAICPDDKVCKSTIGNMHEVCARQGKLIAVTDNTSKELDKMCQEVIEIPKTHTYLTPILSIIPLQLLAYHAAKELKRPIDKPRNLAKSVTVE